MSLKGLMKISTNEKIDKWKDQSTKSSTSEMKIKSSTNEKIDKGTYWQIKGRQIKGRQMKKSAN